MDELGSPTTPPSRDAGASDGSAQDAATLLADFWPSFLRRSMPGFTQPILPGWTFNIDSYNSTSPQTEAAVVAQNSYGRQIGRISDALQVLIEDRGKPVKAQAFKDFLTMKDQVDATKRQARKVSDEAAAVARVKTLNDDLTLLKFADRAEFDRLTELLRGVLKS